MRRAASIGFFIVLSLLGRPEASMAEGLLEVYHGNVNLSGVKISASKEGYLFTPSEQHSETVRFRDARVLGLRYSGFTDEEELNAVALDLSKFETAADDPQGGERARISVFSMGFTWQRRFPALASQAYPRGRLHPYMGLGLYLDAGSVSAKFTPYMTGPVDGDVRGWGLGLSAGASARLGRRVDLFADYLWRSYRLDSEDSGGSYDYNYSTQSVKASFSVSRLSVGLSFRFGKKTSG